MGVYVFSKEAEQDLKGIYRYGFLNHGEKQADQYKDTLKEKCQFLADNPYLYRERDEFTPPVRFYHHEIFNCLCHNERFHLDRPRPSRANGHKATLGRINQKPDTFLTFCPLANLTHFTRELGQNRPVSVFTALPVFLALWCFSGVCLNYTYTYRRIDMTRQSISFTTPNDDWLKAQVESEEYTSKSDVVNDLIRKARAQQNEIEWIRAKLIKSEQSGFIDKTPAEILADFKEEARRNGEL